MAYQVTHVNDAIWCSICSVFNIFPSLSLSSLPICSYKFFFLLSLSFVCSFIHVHGDKTDGGDGGEFNIDIQIRLDTSYPTNGTKQQQQKKRNNLLARKYAFMTLYEFLQTNVCWHACPTLFGVDVAINPTQFLSSISSWTIFFVFFFFCFVLFVRLSRSFVCVRSI